MYMFYRDASNGCIGAGLTQESGVKGIIITVIENNSYCYYICKHSVIFGFEGRIWDLIVSVPDHCLSFYLREE